MTRKIVAVKTGGIITTKWETIRMACARNLNIEPLDQRQMLFMASLDLGVNWNQFKNAPILFEITDDGEILPPSI